VITVDGGGTLKQEQALEIFGAGYCVKNGGTGTLVRLSFGLGTVTVCVMTAVFVTLTVTVYVFVLTSVFVDVTGTVAVTIVTPAKIGVYVIVPVEVGTLM
jgi:hypothetical protein